MADTIVLASIALGDAEPSLCASGIPPGRTVDITLIVEAIGNALGECKPASTPTPTTTTVPTATATSPPSAAGTWTETQLAVTATNCNSATAGIIADAAAAWPSSCDYQVSQMGTAVHAVDCQGDGLDGTVDNMGKVLFVDPAQSETVDNGCTFTISGTIAIDTSRSPTTAAYTLELAFFGPCSPFAGCTAHLQSQWTRD
jgi:hypothetical protein